MADTETNHLDFTPTPSGYLKLSREITAATATKLTVKGGTLHAVLQNGKRLKIALENVSHFSSGTDLSGGRVYFISYYSYEERELLNVDFVGTKNVGDALFCVFKAKPFANGAHVGSYRMYVPADLVKIKQKTKP